MNTVQTLVESHIPFANRIACRRKRGLPKRITVEELQSAAYMGLVEAATRFDAQRGISFTTFAYPRIAGAIIDYLRELGLLLTSLDAPCEDEGCTLGEMVAAPDERSADEAFEAMTTGLDERAQDVLRAYYLDDIPMKAVGARYGVTESRVSQLISQSRSQILSKWTYEDLAA